MDPIKPTATLFLDQRKIKSNKKYPVKLTIYYRPKKKRYSLNVDLSPEEWIKLSTSRLKDDSLKEVKIRLSSILERAIKILDKLEPFSFDSFEAEFFYKKSPTVNAKLEHWFHQYIQKLEAENREGTRASYQTTINSLLSFKPDITLADVTKEFLEGYERKMRERGKSPSTIGIYLRQLRAIINIAKDSGAIERDNYPFKSYTIPTSRNVKKALSDQDLQKLLNHQPTTEKDQRSLDFWILSYLCNGMNFIDILHLKSDNVRNTFLHYVRKKTIRTRKKDLRPIKVPLHPRAIQIIDRWKSKSLNAEYLFPILNEGLSSKEIRSRTHDFIRTVNKSLDFIRLELNIEQKCTTYACRHSFSTKLMRSGANIHIIKESLGHSNTLITESYLSDFPDEAKIKYSEMLTSF